MKPLKKAMFRALRSITRPLPIILTVVLALSLIECLPLKDISQYIGSGGFVSIFLSAIIGAISAGNAMTSYILGGELVKNGLGIGVATAFIVAWVTVGIVQMPAEGTLLGKRFAIVRNAVSFVLAVTTGLIFALIFW